MAAGCRLAQVDGASNDDDVTLTAVAREVSDCLDRLFPESQGVHHVRARSLLCGGVPLASQIFSRRVRTRLMARSPLERLTPLLHLGRSLA